MTSLDSGVARSLDRYIANAPVAAEVAKALARVALGWFLLHQGWGKVVDDWSESLGRFYRGNQFQDNSCNQFQDNNPDWLPAFIAAPYGYALPWLELVMGTLLMLGLFNRLSAEQPPLSS